MELRCMWVRHSSNTAKCVVGKMFCLRGGVEHSELKLSQIQRLSGPDRYVYTENVSKTQNGSFKHLHPCT